MKYHGNERLLYNIKKNPSNLQPELHCSIDLQPKANNKCSINPFDTWFMTGVFWVFFATKRTLLFFFKAQDSTLFFIHQKVATEVETSAALQTTHKTRLQWLGNGEETLRVSKATRTTARCYHKRTHRQEVISCTLITEVPSGQVWAQTASRGLPCN